MNSHTHNTLQERVMSNTPLHQRQPFLDYIHDVDNDEVWMEDIASFHLFLGYNEDYYTKAEVNDMLELAANMSDQDFRNLITSTKQKR